MEKTLEEKVEETLTKVSEEIVSAVVRAMEEVIARAQQEGRLKTQRLWKGVPPDENAYYLAATIQLNGDYPTVETWSLWVEKDRTGGYVKWKLVALRPSTVRDKANYWCSLKADRTPVESRDFILLKEHRPKLCTLALDELRK